MQDVIFIFSNSYKKSISYLFSLFKLFELFCNLFAISSDL